MTESSSVRNGGLGFSDGDCCSASGPLTTDTAQKKSPLKVHFYFRICNGRLFNHTQFDAALSFALGLGLGLGLALALASPPREFSHLA